MTTPEPAHRAPVDQPERVEHRTARTYEVPASPDQVWDAIATAEGISAWMVPTRLDPRVGGEVTFDVGGAAMTGVVTGYEPDRSFAYEEPWPLGTDPDAIPTEMAAWFESIGIPLGDVQDGLPAVGPVATEFLVEAASGGSSVIRVVTSSFGAGADWEHEFFAQMVADLAPMHDRLALHLGGRLTSADGPTVVHWSPRATESTHHQ